MRPEIKKGLGAIVARSEYTRKREGRASAVVLEIGTPQRLGRAGEHSGWWACPYRIVGLQRAVIGHAGGLDSCQSLQLAMQLAAERLLDSPELLRGEIYLGDEALGPHDACWLPLSIARLRLAVGVALRWLRKKSERMTAEQARALGAMLGEANQSLQQLARAETGRPRAKARRRVALP